MFVLDELDVASDDSDWTLQKRHRTGRESVTSVRSSLSVMVSASAPCRATVTYPQRGQQR